MISENGFAEMALSFPGTEPTPHMERTGFRVKEKTHVRNLPGKR